MKIRQIIFLILWTILSIVLNPSPGLAQNIKTNLKDMDLGCIRDLSEVPLPAPEKVKVRSDCRKGDVVVNHIQDVLSQSDCYYKIERTYSVIDACGNKAKITIIISYVYDPVPALADQTIYFDLGCNPDLTNAIPDPGDFEPDHCEARVKWLGDEKEKDGCFYSLIRKYRITLCSRERYILTQIYHWIEDTTPPEIKCENLDLGCNPDSIPTVFDIPVTDDCGEVTIINPSSSIVVNGCEYLITQTITAVDQCGNSTTCSRTIRYTIDTIPPEVLRCGRIIDLGCIDSIGQVPPPLPAPIVVSDNCSDVSVEVTDTVLEETDCKSRLIYYYKISDRCGNYTECRMVYEWVLDTIPPTVECPEEVDLGCNPVTIPGPDPSRVSAWDNCEIVDTLIAIADYLPDGCTYRLGYVYIFVDACGNKTNCLEVFKWTVDNEPPQVNGCGAIFNVPIVNGQPDIPPALPAPIIITDDCGGVLPLQWVDIVNDFECRGELIRTYTISDSCGNTTQCVITYIWTQPSCLDQIKCKDPVNLGCNPDFPADFPTPDVDSYLDGLDCEVKVEVLPDIDIVVVGCNRYYGYTIIFTDECGNKKECREEYSWTYDVTPPTIIECAPDLDLGCITEDEFPGHDHSDKIIAIDNCSDVTISLVSIEAVGDSCDVKYIQWYSIKDECGNESRCMQTIRYTRIDPEAPQVEIPEDTTVFCTVPEPPVFEGKCASASLELIFEFDTGCEDNNCLVYRYWLLTTCDGQQNIGVQVITVECDFTSDVLSQGEVKEDQKVDSRFTEKTGMPEAVYESPDGNRSAKESGELVLYPNPSQNYVVFNLNETDPPVGRIQMNIYDQYGRLVKEGRLEGQNITRRIEVGDLPDGVYVLQLISKDNRIWNKSFLKLK